MEVQQLTPTLPGVDNLLKRSWRIYKERFWVFLGITILPMVFLIPLFLISLLFSEGVFEKNLVLGTFLFLISLALVIIGNIWSLVSLLYAIKDREERIGIGDSFKRGWPKISSFFWILLLISFINTGGFLLFILPGIIFYIWFFFTMYVLVSENFQGMNPF